MELTHIRNFSIIAHIYHGESTLADQIMAITQTVSAHQLSDQLLDDLTVGKNTALRLRHVLPVVYIKPTMVMFMSLI